MKRLCSLDDLELLAKSYQDETIRIRRHLHQHPELSWHEEKTIAFLKEEINSFLPSSLQPLLVEEKKGGLVVDIIYNPSFEKLLFRADIDALPIHEETDLPFSSIYKGIMHACGHDFHTAILLSALKCICLHQLPLQYNLRFVFQRAEENPLISSGGQTLVEEGVLEGISKVYALHIDSKSPPGLFLSKSGPMMANSSSISFKIKCMGGHVMNPERGSNAIDILTDIHSHLRSFILCSLGPKEQIAFVPSISKAGNTCNIMPNIGEATYSFRNFLEPEKKEKFIEELKHRISSIVNLYSNAYLSDFTYHSGYPALVNSHNLYLETKKLLNSWGFKTDVSKPLFAGEDFAYYLNQKPGCFWVIGAKQGQGYDHHTSYFNPDESMLWMGVSFWLLLATHKLI